MNFLKINIADNVAVALEDLPSGLSIVLDDNDIVLNADIPRGHKFAIRNIAVNEDVIKYGYPIGHAVVPVSVGDWVNEKTVKTNLEGVLEYSYNPVNEVPEIQNLNYTFKGYRRRNGEVGIRNEIWIIPTVGCVNGTIQELAQQLREETQLRGVDAVIAYPHNYGCSQLGDDHENTRKVLRNMVKHPNAGGVLVVGLGCENNQVSAFKELLGDFNENRVKFMETQKVADEVETGMELLREIYAVVSKDQRVDVPFSELKVVLKCGGSDGL